MSLSPKEEIMEPVNVYIAAPLFNEPQLDLIDAIEKAIESSGKTCYSPRRDSGSILMTPEEKKVMSNWDPVFNSNVEAIHKADVMIAVLEYLMPPDMELLLFRDDQNNPGEGRFSAIRLPDTGTVWEMGYMRALGKPVVGFHTGETGQLNLMLSHGCNGFLKSMDDLDRYLEPGGGLFDPSALVDFSAYNKEVE